MEGGAGSEVGVWAIISSAVVGFITWIFKLSLNRHIARVDDMEKSLDSHKLYTAENYVKRADMRQAIDEAVRPLADGQDRIEAKLDRLIERGLPTNGNNHHKE